MKHLYQYKQFLNENFYDDFKNKYSKLFNESDVDIKNELDMLLKKIDNETNHIKVINIFDDFLSTNQNTLNDKIEKNENQEPINKIIGDNLKSIYFAIRNVQLKLTDESFNEVFEKSKDKNFKNLMEMKSDKFSDAVDIYIKDYMIPQIEKMSGIKKTQESKIYEQDAQPEVQPTDAQKEKNQKLKTYKEKSKEWFNYVYGMIWDKLKKVKYKMETNKNIMNNIDQLSKLITTSDNLEAKKQLFKKITTLSKEGLNKLSDILKLNKDEIGEF